MTTDLNQQRFFNADPAYRTILSALGSVRICLWINIACSLIAAAPSGHPFDVAAFVGNAEAYFRWGFSPLFYWKFGADMAALALLANCARQALEALGVAAPYAIHLAWKLPFIIANVGCALLAGKIARRFSPASSIWLTNLWLLNPVAIWVTAVHGQVEAMALLCLLGGLELLLAGRYVAAGAVIGVGASVEYFPIADLLVLFVLLVRQVIPIGAAVRVFVAFVITAVVCFAQVFVDPLAHESLGLGLASSAGLDLTNVSAMSLWTFLPELSARWPIAFVTVVAASTLLALRVSNPYRGALIALAFSLAAAVLFDALSLPQFAFIAFAALAVLATVVPVSPVAMLVVPLLAMATYTRDIQVAGFWTDVLTPEVPMALNFYLPAATGDLIGELFVLAYAGTFAWSFARSAPGAAGYRLAGLASAALTFGILAFSLQPQIWCNAFNHSLKDLGTFGVRTAIQRAGVQPTTKPGTFRVSFASLTWRWFQRSDVRPASTLRFKVDPYVDTLVATPVFQPLRANGLYAVRTPLAPLPRVVRDVRLEVLLSDPGWTGAGAVGPGAAAVVLGRSRYAFTDYRPIGPGQVVFDFPVPARELIDARGVAHFRLALLGRNTLVARQDKSSTVWLRVSAGTGLTSAAERLPYECDLDGDCRVLGVRWALTQVVTLDPEALPNPTGIVAALEYPMDLPPIHGGPWTVALGFVYWLVMLGALAGVAWLGMRAPPVRA